MTEKYLNFTIFLKRHSPVNEDQNQYTNFLILISSLFQSSI